MKEETPDSFLQDLGEQVKKWDTNKNFVNSNCAVHCQAADDRTFGRCRHTLQRGCCPAHGDVTMVMAIFEHTGRHVLENEMSSLETFKRYKEALAARKAVRC